MDAFVKVCLRKSWFADREMAEQAAARIRANKSDPNNARMVAYLCPFANHYYVGHVKKRKQNKANQG